MVTETQAAERILDCDGSCRDITFTPTSESATVAFLHALLTQYHVDWACDYNGHDRSQQLHTDESLDGIDGYLHVILIDDQALIPHLQLFIDQDQASGEYCLEATFFPNDLDAQRFSMSKFRKLIDNWNAILQADDYFVRYENASWQLYDVTDLSVIYSRKRPPVESPAERREPEQPHH